MKLEHFYSDFNGMKLSGKSYNDTPSEQTVREAKTLGRVVVGNAVIKYDEGHNCGLITVIVSPSNGLTQNVYRDMYRIVN